MDNKKSEKSYIDIILEFKFKAFKIFLIKSLLILLTKRKVLFMGEFTKIIKYILSKSNIKFSLALALISFLNKLFFKFLKNYVSPDGPLKYITIFMASFIAINQFKDSGMFSFIVLLLFTRVFANFLSFKFKQYNIFQEDSRKYDLSLFIFATIIWTLSMFLHPQYSFIPNTVQRYAQFLPSEVKEFGYLMDNMKLVK